MRVGDRIVLGQGFFQNRMSFAAKSKLKTVPARGKLRATWMLLRTGLRNAESAELLIASDVFLSAPVYP